MPSVRTLYRNRLPHIAPLGATFFVTFRLFDSLPQSAVKRLKAQMHAEQEMLLKECADENGKNTKLQILNVRRKVMKKYFGKFDHQLDEKPYGSCYLKTPEVARILHERLFEFDNQFYHLEAFCIMPNHIHILISTSIQLERAAAGTFVVDIDNKANVIVDGYVQLDRIMKLLKGGSGRRANQHLGRTGPFWFKDSYDHYIRSRKEWKRIVRYILNNPVKAGLSADWQDWPYSYVKYSPNDW